HSVTNRVHRTTDIATIFVTFPEVHAEHDLSVLGGHADHRCDPHPEHRSWTTQSNGSCNAYDVANPNRRRKTGHQRGEGADFAVAPIAFTALPYHAQALTNHQNRHAAQTNLQIKAGAENQYQHRWAPHDAIYRVEQFSHDDSLCAEGGNC